MCSLYSNLSPRGPLLKKFGVSDNRGETFDLKDAIFPGQMAPVIRITAEGDRELVNMTWGFFLNQKGKAPRRVFNTRDDKVLQSPFWKDSFAQRRCLVPATSFAEPKGEKPATWHWFALQGNEPRPLFAFPGIWKHHTSKAPGTATPIALNVFSFMTTLPNSLVSTINHERMPVLLTSEEEFHLWLTGDTDQAMSLIHSYPAEQMAIVKAGREKRDFVT